MQLHDLREAVVQWCGRYEQRAWLRQLEATITPEMEDALLRTIARLDGTPFPSTAELAGRWARGRVRRQASAEGTYCAEVVAATYTDMGLLDGERPTNYYDPGRFWSGDDLELQLGARSGRRDRCAGLTAPQAVSEVRANSSTLSREYDPASVPSPCATWAAVAQPSSAAARRSRPSAAAAQEAGGEGVAAAGRVDDVDRVRRHLDLLVGGHHERALAALGDGDAADAALEQGAGSLGERGGAGEAEHLLVVGQQVVGVRQGVADPLEHVGVARREDVERRGGARRARVREELAGGLAAEELRPTQVDVA